MTKPSVYVVGNDLLCSVVQGAQHEKYSVVMKLPRASDKEEVEANNYMVRIFESREKDGKVQYLWKMHEMKMILFAFYLPRQFDESNIEKMEQAYEETSRSVTKILLFASTTLAADSNTTKMYNVLEWFRKNGFAVNFQCYDAADFGSAMHREVLVMFAEKKKEKPNRMPIPRIHTSIGEALKDVLLPLPSRGINIIHLSPEFRALAADIPEGEDLTAIPAKRRDLLLKDDKPTKNHMRRPHRNQQAPNLSRYHGTLSTAVLHYMENRCYTTEETQVLMGISPVKISNLKNYPQWTRLDTVVPPGLVKHAVAHLRDGGAEGESYVKVGLKRPRPRPQNYEQWQKVTFNIKKNNTEKK